MSSSQGVDLEGAASSVLGGVGSCCARRKRGRRTAAAALLIALVAACTPDAGIDASPDPDPDLDPDPGPSAICVDDTAANYATEIGLDVDVSHFDANDTEAVDGCSFTIWERDLLDAYKTVQAENRISEETGAPLEAFNEYFTVAGPWTANGFIGTYEMWKDNVQYEDVEFTPEKVGVFANPLGDLRLPGTFNARDFGPLTNYPIDDRVLYYGLLNWSNQAEGVTSTFLSELAGYDGCSEAQDTRISSFDMALNLEIESGEVVRPWYEVNNIFLGEAEISKIFFRDEMSPTPHTSLDIQLEARVHEHDKHLLPPGTVIRVTYNHTIDQKEPRFITDESELVAGLREGTTVQAGETFAYIDSLRAGVLLDLLISAPAEDFPDFGPSYNGRIFLDPAAAEYYPDGFEPRFLDQRFVDDRNYGPCGVSDEGVPLPDEPHASTFSTASTTSFSTIGDEFVFPTE